MPCLRNISASATCSLLILAFFSLRDIFFPFSWSSCRELVVVVTRFNTLTRRTLFDDEDEDDEADDDDGPEPDDDDPDDDESFSSLLGEPSRVVVRKRLNKPFSDGMTANFFFFFFSLFPFFCVILYRVWPLGCLYIFSFSCWYGTHTHALSFSLSSRSHTHTRSCGASLKISRF